MRPVFLLATLAVLLALASAGLAYSLDPSGRLISSPTEYRTVDYQTGLTTRGPFSNEYLSRPVVRVVLDSRYATSRPYGALDRYGTRDRSDPYFGRSFDSYYYDDYPVRSRLVQSATSKERVVYARNGRCLPANLYLLPNETITLRFVNQDSSLRSLSIPGMGIQSPRVRPDDQHTVVLTAPSYARSFQLNCQ